MTPAEFDDRVHDLLDRRRDPLADPACTAFLAEHPERAPDLARLLERCAALATPVAASPAATAADAAAADATAPAADATAAAAATPPGRVLAAELRPIPRTLQATVRVRAHSVLLDRPDARFETFAQWNTP
jgi:hypothetical protein